MYYGGPYSHNPFALGEEFSFEVILFLVLFSIIIVFMVCGLPLLIKWLMTSLLTSPSPTPSVCVCPELGLPSHQAPVSAQWLQDQLCASHVSIDMEEFVTPCSTPPVEAVHECHCGQEQDTIKIMQDETAQPSQESHKSGDKSIRPTRRFARSLGCLTDERVFKTVRKMRADLAPLEVGGRIRFARKKKRILDKVKEEDERVAEEEKEVEKEDEVVDEEDRMDDEKKEEKKEETMKKDSKTIEEQESEP